MAIMADINPSNETSLGEEDGVFLFAVKSNVTNHAYLGEGLTVEEAKADAYRTKEIAEEYLSFNSNEVELHQAVIQCAKNGMGSVLSLIKSIAKRIAR